MQGHDAQHSVMRGTNSTLLHQGRSRGPVPPPRRRAVPGVVPTEAGKPFFFSRLRLWAELRTKGSSFLSPRLIAQPPLGTGMNALAAHLGPR